MATGGWGAQGAWGPSKPNWAQEEEAPAQSYVPPSSDAYTPPAPTPDPEPAQSSFFGKAFGASKSQAQGGSAWGAGGASTSAGDIENREEALRRKEAELAERERKVTQMEETLRATGAIAKKNNWPICFPLTHHDIAGEIPDTKKRVVREAYMAWWGLAFCLCYNLFAACVVLGYDADDKVASWFLAVIYWLTGIPLGFILWYRKIYNSARDDSTFGFLTFFLWFGIHTAFCIWAAIAIPFSTNKWSFAGFVTAMSALDLDTAPGIIYLIGASFWTVEAVYSFWVIKDVYFFFRGKGGVQQVKQEAALAAFKAGLSNSNRV